MWKYICPLLLAALLGACHTSKKVSETENLLTESYTLPDTLSASVSFRMFWDEWNRELQQAGVPLAQYVPSDELAQRYILRQNQGIYCLTGFLHTYPNFNPQSLIELGGNCVAYGEGIYTFSIPVIALPQFVALPGIKYIESASPVHMRR